MSVDLHAADLDGLGEYQLVDIRTADEVAQAPLPCPHVHIPMDALLANPSVLKQDQPVVLVCAAGIRTRFAAEMLRGAGYSQVYSLVGGNQMLSPKS